VTGRLAPSKNGGVAGREGIGIGTPAASRSGDVGAAALEHAVAEVTPSLPRARSCPHCQHRAPGVALCRSGADRVNGDRLLSSFLIRRAGFHGSSMGSLRTLSSRLRAAHLPPGSPTADETATPLNKARGPAAAAEPANARIASVNPVNERRSHRSLLFRAVTIGSRSRPARPQPAAVVDRGLPRLLPSTRAARGRRRTRAE
jgi:hypothetical protein